MIDESRRDRPSSSSTAQEYVEAALAFGNSQKVREFESGNQFADVLERLGSVLRESAEGRFAIVDMLQHSDAYVRLWAAKDALPFAPDQAVAVLETIGAAKGLIGTAARMTLGEWRAGRLFRGSVPR